MSDIARWNAAGDKWVRYDDHRAEVERLTARQTEMETHITGLTTELHRTRADGIELRWVAGEVEQLTAERDAAQANVERLKNAIDHLTSERNEAQAEVERLKGQVAALTLAVEQANKMKALAEIAAAWKEAKTDRVMSERDAARAEVERLTAERDEACGEVERLTRMTVADFALAQYRKRWLR